MGNISHKTIDSPDFLHFAQVSNDALIEVARQSGFTTDDIDKCEAQAGRLVDDMTMLLLRMRKNQQKELK